MWSAEQMIKRLIIRLGRMNAACNNADASVSAQSFGSL